MTRIYLDYNASTPIDPAVIADMRPFLEENFGNPSSGHWASTAAKAALVKAASATRPGLRLIGFERRVNMAFAVEDTRVATRTDRRAFR